MTKKRSLNEYRQVKEYTTPKKKKANRNKEGIDTISVTPDSMLKTIKAIHKIETKK
jgi:hypothetical protein